MLGVGQDAGHYIAPVVQRDGLAEHGQVFTLDRPAWAPRADWVARSKLPVSSRPLLLMHLLRSSTV